jgi:hypothetical protein
MANYLHLATSRYPVSQSQIRAENPQTSYPASFPVPDGYAVVFPAPAPSCDPVTQIAREIAPVLTSKGHYEQAYEIVSRFVEYTDEQNVVHTVAEQEAAAIQADAIAKTQAFIASVVSATQSRLDTFAQTKNYDGILSACTYASSAIPKFASEGQYAVNARDNTWATLYTIMGEVEAGTLPMPASVDEVMSLLPELVWPI